MCKVDLNSDLGESFGAYTIGNDEKILKYVSSVNIACGWHAGDPLVMENTVSTAQNNNVSIGAHPGFLDLLGFGRRNIDISPTELKAYIKYQLGALMAFTASKNTKIQHVKPHGAMYNMCAKNYTLSKAVCEAIYEVDKNIILLGLCNSEMITAGKDIGLKVANEVFADRAYEDDGTLVPRSKEGSVIHDEILAINRTIRMIKEGTVTSINGNNISINAHSICIHGDNPKAIEFAKNIRQALSRENIEVCSLSNLDLE